MRALFMLTFAVSCARPGPGPTPAPEEPTPVTLTPELTVAVTLSRAQVSVGQRLIATLDVGNEGDGAATSVGAMAIVQSGLGRVRQVGATTTLPSLAAGARQQISIELEAVDPGPVGLAFAVQGLDEAQGRSVASPGTTTLLTVQSTPFLSMERPVAPTSANVGDSVTIRVTAVNGGEAKAREVRLELLGSGASPPFSLGAPMAPFDLEPGAAQTVSVQLSASAAGTLSLEAKISGLDDNTSTRVESDVVPLAPISIERPAALEASLSVPAQATRGQRVMAVLSVRNTGTTVASRVTPSTLFLIGGTATVGVVSPAEAEVPGGGSVQFEWFLDLTEVSTMTVQASVSGTDSNTSAIVQGGPVTSAPLAVVEPTALQVVSLVGPSVINPGQAFDVTLTVRNRGAAAATGVVPDPASPAQARTLGASALLQRAPAPQTIGPGQTGAFIFRYLENGTSTGTLAFTVGARGTDMVSGSSVSAVPVQSNRVAVMAPPQLVMAGVLTPRFLSVGQTFSVTLQVRNSGESLATQVTPRLVFGGSTSDIVTPPAPADVPAGGVRPFVFALRHSGLSNGQMTVTGSATGTNAFLSQPLTAAALSAISVVQRPAALAVTWVQLPDAIAPGREFSLGAVVSNTGEANATQVVPNPLQPTAQSTGGALASVGAAPVAQTIPGSRSRAFVWTYRENGTAPGTLAFSVGAQGTDGNSAAALTATARSTPLGAGVVGSALTCGGSAMYIGLGGERLDADRLTLAAGSDRLRIKPYSMLGTEFATRLGTTPAGIRNQQSTFDVAQARWFGEQELSAVSISWSLIAAFQACEVSTRTAGAFATAPTAATANVQCATWQRATWSAEPSTAELAECVRFATSPQAVGTTPRLTWATVCSAVVASAGFLSH